MNINQRHIIISDFKCLRCGKCCGIVPFHKKEYKAIRDFAKKKHIAFQKVDWLGKTVYFPKDAYKNFLIATQRAMEEDRELDNQFDNLVCPFKQFENGLSSCMIYENRPEICRMYGVTPHKHMACPNNPILTRKV